MRGPDKLCSTPPSILTVSRYKYTKMPPYNDSDDEDIQDYTETKVLLGYAEEEAGNDTISHLGGEPVCPLVPRDEMELCC